MKEKIEKAFEEALEENKETDENLDSLIALQEKAFEGTDKLSKVYSNLSDKNKKELARISKSVLSKLGLEHLLKGEK